MNPPSSSPVRAETPSTQIPEDQEWWESKENREFRAFQDIFHGNLTDCAELPDISKVSPDGVWGGNEKREKDIPSITLEIQFWR